MAYRQKTPGERIAESEKRLKQIQAAIARDKAKLKDQERKDDTRRKIIAGALALEHEDATFQATLKRLLHQYVTKEQDRKLFGLDPLQTPETPPPS